MLEGPLVDAAQILHFKDHIILDGIFLRRIYIGQLTSYHLADNLIITDVFYFPGTNIRAITHDGNIIGDLTDLSHLMGDVDHGYASGSKIPDNTEQSVYLVIRKGRRRLVQDHYFRIHGYGLCDLDRLHLGNRKRAKLCFRIVRHFDIFQPFGCFFIHGLMVNVLERSDRFQRIAAKIHILRDCPLRDRLQLLMNHSQSFV